jgi:hypothetical protein
VRREEKSFAGGFVMVLLHNLKGPLGFEVPGWISGVEQTGIVGYHSVFGWDRAPVQVAKEA